MTSTTKVNANDKWRQVRQEQMRAAADKTRIALERSRLTIQWGNRAIFFWIAGVVPGMASVVTLMAGLFEGVWWPFLVTGTIYAATIVAALYCNRQQNKYMK